MESSSDERLIEDITKSQRLGVLQNFTAVSVAFSATFTTALSIFTSVLLLNYHTYNTSSIDIPILFLIISTFGFLYSTMVYSLNAGHLIHAHLEKFWRGRHLGGILSEYLGVYFLLLAIPLIINIISSNDFLRISTTTIDLVGLFIYHLSGFSIMERNYKKLHFLWLAIISVFEILLLQFQFLEDKVFLQYTVFQILAAFLILFIFFIAIFPFTEPKKYKDPIHWQ